MLLLFLCILNSKALQSFPLPLCGALLDLFRIFMRFLDMKYGFWREPSFRSRSSTVKQEHVTRVGVNFSFSVSVSQRGCSGFTHRSRERVCPHTCCTHWRIRELWGSFQPQRSVQHRDKIRIYQIYWPDVDERQKKNLDLTIIGIQ